MEQDIYKYFTSGVDENLIDFGYLSNIERKLIEFKNPKIYVTTSSLASLVAIVQETNSNQALYSVLQMMNNTNSSDRVTMQSLINYVLKISLKNSKYYILDKEIDIVIIDQKNNMHIDLNRILILDEDNDDYFIFRSIN